MDKLKLTGASIFGASIINFEEIEFRQQTGKISPVSFFLHFLLLYKNLIIDITYSVSI